MANKPGNCIPFFYTMEKFVNYIETKSLKISINYYLEKRN